MPRPSANLAELLRTMEPELHDGVYIFTSVAPDMSLASIEPLATFHEKEGMTVIVREEEALRLQLPIRFRAAWITLTVSSDLQAIGLTAAVATALAEHGISCNVVAAACHDHIFVPVERAYEALERLKSLQREAGAETPIAHG